MAAVRLGDGGLGRRVLEEGAQLWPPADVCDWRHRGAAVAAAAAHRHGDRAQRHAAADRAGAKIFNTYCARCHGGATILPDLRRSTPGIYTGLEKILDGSLAERGMPRFAELDKAAVASCARMLDERRKLAAEK